MANKLLQFIFFGNYFVGILIVALSLETAFQLRLPFNSLFYYAFMFCVVVLYYTYAYSNVANANTPVNARTAWYSSHQKIVPMSQRILLFTASALGLWLVMYNVNGILKLPVYYWFILVVIIVAALLYYGLVPGLFLRLKLRNIGWLKAFVIGFLWASCASLLPVVALKIEKRVTIRASDLLFWSFIKNWMFCSVNAIMFDIKDYADDSNQQLKTFVVHMGLRKTIFFILFPLLIIGLVWLIIFTSVHRFRLSTVLFNLAPFISLLFVVYSLHKRRSILYYLVVIDGVLLFKACCGIAGSLIAR